MNKPLILVVEDDRPVRNLIVTTLKSHDYRYLTAENGHGAIMEATSHNPDIVLLDLGLPDIDGTQVIESIRSWSNMPIIVISARSEDRDKIMALDAGADDYLTKPFGVMEFVSRIRALLRRFSSKKKQISVIGNRQKIELNKDAREVFVKGEKCPLTYKEFELLQVLMSHADQVMTRDSLMELIWGVDFFGESRTLDMHIRTLRKKLGEAGSQIQTIRNVGYCFRKTEDETE